MGSLSFPFEIYSDQPDRWKITRLGHWIHVQDYQTGYGQWTWAGPFRAPQVLAKKLEAEKEFIALFGSESEAQEAPGS